MLSINPKRDAGKLYRYFIEDLALESETELSPGLDASRMAAGLAPTWHGEVVKHLQLPEFVTPAALRCLCENRHPATMDRLTPRMKLDRIVAYDFTFSVPKGLSLIYLLGGDDRIVPVVRRAVESAMGEVERHIRTRVRAGGAMDDRLTANMLYAMFTHRLARPENGVADPQIHVHALGFNVTRDFQEKMWKAAKVFDIAKNAPYFERVFHQSLQRETMRLGYQLEPKGKFWDVRGLPPGLTEKFSSRTKEIKRTAAQHGIKHPKAVAQIGARSRERKSESVRGKDLRQAWERRLSPLEREFFRTTKPDSLSDKEFDRSREANLRRDIPDAFAKRPSEDEARTPGSSTYRSKSSEADRVGIKGRPIRGRAEDHLEERPAGGERDSKVEFESPSRILTKLKPSTSLRAVVRHAAQVIFERIGVVTERDFVNQVLLIAPRAGIDVNEVRREMQTLNLDRRMIADTAVLVDPVALADEKRLVQRVIAGRGQFAPILPMVRIPASVPRAVHNAIRAIGRSPDLVTVVESIPGDASRTVLQAITKALPFGPVLDLRGALSLSAEERSRALTPTLRHGVVVVSPSAAGANEGLRETVSRKSSTVAKFLADPDVRNHAVKGVVIVDQAHLLTTSDANRLLDAVAQVRGRLVLLSEESLTRPHGAGNVPRLLWEKAAIKASFVAEAPHGKTPLSEPLKLAAHGEPAKAVERLEKDGKVALVKPEHVAIAAANEYLQGSSRKGWKPTQSLVVTPTKEDRDAVTDAVRGAMKERGLLGRGKDRLQLEPLNLSDAAKRRSETYKPGMVIEFNENVTRKLAGVPVSRNYKAGDRWDVVKQTPLGVAIKRGLRTGLLPSEHGSKFGVYEKGSKQLAPGDVIRFTKGMMARTRLESVANKTFGMFRVPRHAVESGRSYAFKRFTKAGHMQLKGGLVVPKDFGHWAHDYARTPAQCQGVKRDRVVFATRQDSKGSAENRAFLSSIAAAKKSFKVVTDNVQDLKDRLSVDRRRVLPSDVERQIVPPRFGWDPSGPRSGRADNRASEKAAEEERRKRAHATFERD